MPASPSQEIVLQGIPVSPGIGIGPVHVVARGFSAPEVYEIGEQDVEAEQERFAAALAETKTQLHDLQQRIKSISASETSSPLIALTSLFNSLNSVPLVNFVPALNKS
mgnify:CR=1 FL=1